MIKQLLILDLDNTLIYADLKPMSNYDFKFTCKGDQIWVKKRPQLNYFLNNVATNFDLAIWSASCKEYVNEIIKHIFKDIKLVFVYTEKQTITKFTFDDFENTMRQYTTKDLKKIWSSKKKFKMYNKSNTLILDDIPENFRNNRGNGINITGYYGNVNDTELNRIYKMLEKIKITDNVRIVNKN